MRTITRHCDRCKKEIPPKDWGQIWRVSIHVVNEELASRYNNNSGSDETQEWCRDCVDAMRLIGRAWNPKKEGDTTPEPTFDDRLRELMREEIEAATGGRA